MKRLCLLALSILMVTGCATQPPRSSIVEIFKDGETPARKYERIKLLYNVNWESNENDAMRYFVNKAEILNADALVVLPREREGFKVYPFGKIGVKYKYKALAVKWTEKQ